MIRKITAIFFILLANIVLLVHAVVPHHHHKSLICIESNTCQSDSYPHNSTSAHEHDGSAETENCELRQVLAIPGNSVKQELKCLGCDNNHSTFVHFQAILFVNEYISFVPLLIQNAQISLNISSHSCFVSTSLGLRAPPVV